MFQLHNLVVVHEPRKDALLPTASSISLGLSNSRIQTKRSEQDPLKTTVRSIMQPISEPKVQEPAIQKDIWRDIRKETNRRPEIVKSDTQTMQNKSRPSSNILIQILCYNEESEKLAHKRFGKFEWASIYRTSENETVDGLQENCMYREVLLRKQNEWMQKDFVGTLSYKATIKIDVAKVDRMIQTQKLAKTNLFQLDAIFFFCSASSVHQCNSLHTNFSKIWNDVLVGKCRITSTAAAQCNFWMARPSVMTVQIRWFQSVLWPAVRSHPLSMTNSRQIGRHSKDTIQKCNGGKPFQVHVPFILERVPRNFFQDWGYTIGCM